MTFTAQPYPRFYAGVGSRATPPEQLDYIQRLSFWLNENGWTLRTGAAKGADSAFIRGVCGPGWEDRLRVYAPWPNFKTEFHRLQFAATAPEPWACELAEKLHPAWGACGGGARSLLSRDVHQVLGLSNEPPSEFVLCWTKDGAQLPAECTRDTGGTAMAIRVAGHMGIRVFNLQRGSDEFRAFADRTVVYRK